ncbi:MAG: tetratricopeptide repeat protein [Chloroflexi bacterium]|nr:tetratricopeptide repeat protein [Chloroflexota bacterium]
MSTSGAAYLPPDRLHALVAGESLLQSADGSALFADISGFTPITERLRSALGARRGAEELAIHLNRVYDALIAQVNRFGGSIIGFAGDAITCWFGGDAAAERAVTCGTALLKAMQDVERITLPDGDALLRLKVAVTSGMTRRFVVGDPAIQRIDALAGQTVARLAAGEGLAEPGEILVDNVTLERVPTVLAIREWREEDGEAFAVLELADLPGLHPPIAVTVSGDAVDIPDALLLPWLLPALARQIQTGLNEFPIELRPVTTLFLRFAGIDYDVEVDAQARLDGLVQVVQRVVERYEGSVLQLTIGDKGSYLYAAFGAPFAHEDDPARALNAAIDMREQIAQIGGFEPVQIGISRGIVRTGAYGGSARRTYGALGDEVNLSARLMSRADPGAILVSEALFGARLVDFELRPLPSIQVKGKAQPIQVFELIGRRDRSFEDRFYTTPLIGREGELAQAQAALQPIFEGRHAGILYLYGEPGIGKSRLAFEMQQHLQSMPGVAWFVGQADVLNRQPLAAFSYFLRPAFGQRREQNEESNRAAFEAAFQDLLTLADADLREELVRTQSYLAALVGLIIPGSSFALAEERTRAENQITAIKTWARVMSSRGPLILHLEDAQWLDALSVRAIQQLTYNLDDRPLALLLTSRYNDDGTPKIISNVGGVPVHTIDLNRLSDEGIRAVVQAELGGPVGETLARFIRERAEGNPFFTEQLVLDLQERGALSESADGWDLREGAGAEIPAGVNGVLIARLDRLAAQVKTVVQTASVLGREFDVMVLSRMLREAEVPSIHAAEREAIWSALDEIRYLFRHALLRDAAYDMQAQERLKALHRLAAEAIESIYGPDEGAQDYALMEHWHAAAEFGPELVHLLRLVQPLINVQAEYRDAIRLIDRALSRLEPQASQRITLLRYKAVALRHLGDNAGALATATESLSRAEESNDRIAVGRAMYFVGTIALLESDYDAAQMHFLRAIPILQEAGALEDVADVQMQLGVTNWYKGEFPPAEAHWEACLQTYIAVGSRLGQTRVLNALGVLAYHRGEGHRARDFLMQSITIARQDGDKTGISDASNNLGNVATWNGQFVEARTYFLQSLAMSREQGRPRGVGIALHNLGRNSTQLGAYQEGIDYFRQAIAVRRETGDRWGVGASQSNLGSSLQHIGALREGHVLLTEALELQREIDNQEEVSISLRDLADNELQQGLYDSARAHLREYLALDYEFMTPSNRGYGHSILGDVERDSGSVTQARDAYTTALALYEAPDEAINRADVQLRLSILEMGLGRLEAARDLFAQALPIIEAEARDSLRQDARYHQACLTWIEGRHAEAERQFVAVLARARETGYWRQTHALFWLARIAHQKEERKAAAAYWQESARLLMPDDARPAKLEALVVAAEILIGDGALQRARQGADFVAGHPEAAASTRRDAEQLRSKMVENAPMVITAHPLDEGIAGLIASL